MTPEDIAKCLELKERFITKDDIYRAMAEIYWRGIKFHQELWSEDLKQRAKNELYMKKHPKEFRARERSFMFWMTRFPIVAEQKNLDADGKAIDINKLREMNLSDDQLKTIAGIEDKEE